VLIMNKHLAVYALYACSLYSKTLLYLHIMRAHYIQHLAVLLYMHVMRAHYNKKPCSICTSCVLITYNTLQYLHVMRAHYIQKPYCTCTLCVLSTYKHLAPSTFVFLNSALCITDVDASVCDLLQVIQCRRDQWSVCMCICVYVCMCLCQTWMLLCVICCR